MAAATTGLVASSVSSHAAVIYTEGLDLANTAGAAAVISSGTVGDEVVGNLDVNTDANDHYIVGGFTPGGTAAFDMSFTKNDPDFSVNFTFTDPTNENVLGSTGAISANDFAGGTMPFIVPSNGQIRVSVQNAGISEAGGPGTSWSVSASLSTVPEPSGAALLALGSLLALKRRR